MESREGIALQNQIFQMKQDLQILHTQIDRGNYGGGGGGGGEIAAQLLSRVQAMEEQVRQLRGRIDETQNLVIRQNAELSKRIDDLTFQLNLQGKGGGTSTPPPRLPTPPAVREVAPKAALDPMRPPDYARLPDPPRATDPLARSDQAIRSDQGVRPDQGARLVIPPVMPSINLPPRSPPPRGRLQQSPEPMRDRLPPPPQPGIDPMRPVTRPPIPCRSRLRSRPTLSNHLRPRSPSQQFRPAASAPRSWHCRKATRRWPAATMPPPRSPRAR